MSHPPNLFSPQHPFWLLLLSVSSLLLVSLTTIQTRQSDHLLPPQLVVPPASSPFVPGASKPLTRDELRKIVGENPQFLAKDSQISYGYNNLRYMFEASMNLAKLTGRIPILPEAVWARACAVQSEICNRNSLRHFEHRNSHEEDLGAKWNEDGEIWELGIEEFLDVAHLRQSFGPVLTLREFFLLYDLDPSLIHPSGHFDAVRYLPPGLDITVISSEEFEHRPFVRVDRFEEDWGHGSTSGANGGEKGGLEESVVREAMGWHTSWTLEDARTGLANAGTSLSDDDELATVELRKLGQVPLYTFSDEVIMNKAVARPTTEFAPLSLLLSLQNISSTFSTSDILFFQGDLHDQRKPGALRFSKAFARDAFSQSVQRGVKPPPGVWALADRVVTRIEERVGGRRWLAAHLRRGDFIGINWSDDSDPFAHFDLAKTSLATGLPLLAAHYPTSSLPLPTDPFYLATDETNSTALAYYRSSGALLLRDLLFPSDVESTLGGVGSFSDVRALVEQVVLARSDYFVGSRMSSTTGGAVNLRLARGAGEWSWGLVGMRG